MSLKFLVTNILLVLIIIVVSLIFVVCEGIKLDGRVACGHDADRSSQPFIVSLQKNNLHDCAGTIINKNWIITAAHCIKSDQDAKKIKIYAGVYDLKSIKAGNDKQIQQRNINRYIRHKLYTGGAKPYDIALIHVNKPFEFTKVVQPIKLPKSNMELKGVATLYGWGSISKTETESYPDKLQISNMRIITNEECKKALKNQNVIMNVHSTNMCTMGGINLSSEFLTSKFLFALNSCDGNCATVCNGDSGGPLVNQNQQLIGIVSWGITPCGQCKAPSVYVRVPSFIQWIEETIKKS